MKNQTQEIFDLIQNRNFTVHEQFLVADLTEQPKLFANIPVGKHGLEQVCKNKQTKSHAHTFLSIYKSEDLHVLSGKQKTVLPKKSLVIVPPGVEHSWIPQKQEGVVGSVDHRHRKQVLQPAPVI